MKILLNLCLIASLAMVAQAVINYAKLPNVYFSVSTQKCKKVEYEDGTITDCKNMPVKYEIINIK